MLRKAKKHSIPLSLLGLCLLITGLYVGWIKTYVVTYFEGTSPEWFNSLIEYAYPRLITEQHRLPPEFFIEKAQQVIIRFDLAALCIAIVIYCYQQNEKLRNRLHEQLMLEANPYKVRIITFVYFSFLIFTTHEWLTDFSLLAKASAFYRPVGFYAYLPFPSVTVASVLVMMMWLSAFASALDVKPKISNTLGVGLFILLEGYFMCFEKTDHGYVTFIYAGLGLVLYQFNRFRFWPILMTQLAIALCYFLAGTEKLLISHFDWLSSDTFAAYLSIHPTTIGSYLLSSPVLLTILPFLVILFQLSFPLVFLKKWRLWILTGGILFHFSTVMIMDIGSYFHPWVIVYVFYIKTTTKE